MARIKKFGLGIMGIFKKNFRSEEVLPNEFAELRKPMKSDYTNFML